MVMVIATTMNMMKLMRMINAKRRNLIAIGRRMRIITMMTTRRMMRIMNMVNAMKLFRTKGMATMYIMR